MTANLTPRCCQLSPYECTTPSYLHLLPPQFHPTQPPLSHCCTMPDPISCLRCTNYCLQCSGATSAPVPGRSKNICQQCDSAGLDCCLFPPGIRLINPRTSVRCYSCAEHHMKCIFLNATDSQCTRCSKQHLTCCFKLSGKYDDVLFHFHIFNCLFLSKTFVNAYYYLPCSLVDNNNKVKEREVILLGRGRLLLSISWLCQQEILSYIPPILSRLHGFTCLKAPSLPHFVSSCRHRIYVSPSYLQHDGDKDSSSPFHCMQPAN